MIISMVLCIIAVFQLLDPILPRLLSPVFPSHRCSSVVNIVCVLISVLVVLGWALTAHWLLLDLIGCSICVMMLTVVRIPSTRVALFLFAGLLVYDVFWVFFSAHFFTKNVMLVR